MDNYQSNGQNNGVNGVGSEKDTIITGSEPQQPDTRKDVPRNNAVYDYGYGSSAQNNTQSDLISSAEGNNCRGNIGSGQNPNGYDNYGSAQEQYPQSSYSYNYGGGMSDGGYGTPLEPVEQVPQKKTRFVTKAVACAVCAAVISAGSIGLYKYIDDNFSFKNFFGTMSSQSSEENIRTDDTSGNSAMKGSGKGEPKSLMELAARKDGLSVPEAVEKVMPAVVGISAKFPVQTSGYDPSFFYGFGYGYGNSGGTRIAASTGTGIVMTSDGYVITNAHIVYDSEHGYGRAASVSIVMPDETTYDTTIIGYDVDTDIAVLKMDAKGLSPAEFGNSDDLQVGELVLAIGNPLGFELFGSVTSGIVSALNRDISINSRQISLIQTDAAINKGNSGGPLINSYGQVIGINSRKISSTYLNDSTTIEGLGFAIPITQAKEIIDDLVEYGYVTGRPQVGITGKTIDEQISALYGMPVGVYVTSVEEGGSASLGGIVVGDIIIGADGKAVATTEELTNAINKHKAGEEIKLTICRQGRDAEVILILQEEVGNVGMFDDRPVERK